MFPRYKAHSHEETDMKDENIDDVLSELEESLRQSAAHFMGYPCNMDFDYSKILPFLKYPINNVGDPYIKSLYGLHTHEMECEVLDEYADMVRAPKDDRWGYVTSGGTEGNMYGIYLAREMYPKCTVYFSEDTHYSVLKILRLTNTNHVKLRSLPNGEINYLDLRDEINLNRHNVPVIFANIGTTMKGANDNIANIKQLLSEINITKYYIHADAALHGMMLPYMDNPPPFDFGDGIDSISVSGHKFIGSPLPCGMVIAKKSNVDIIANSVEYIGTMDTTISGSRSGFTPLVLWFAFKNKSRLDFREMVYRCIHNADYMIEKCNNNGIPAWRNPSSNTVIIPRPSDVVVKKWQIAVQGDIAHVIVMPHVGHELIDAMTDELIHDQQKKRK